MIGKIEKILGAEPNLMAKDLAKRLGCKKNELTSILHANLDNFAVDSEYHWSLKGKEITISFEGNCWVNCDSFEATLQNSSDALDGASKVVFILPEGCSFLLDALARLLALCNQLAHSDKAVAI